MIIKIKAVLSFCLETSPIYALELKVLRKKITPAEQAAITEQRALQLVLKFMMK